MLEASPSYSLCELLRHTVERPNRTVWKSLCDNDPACSYYQTPSWVGLISSLAGWRDNSVLVSFDDGLVAVVPRVTRPQARGLFRMTEFAGVYGPPVLRGGPLRREHLDALASLFGGVRSGEGFLSEVPGHPLDFATERQTRTTHLLQLEPLESEHSLLARYRKGHRADVLRARREGVDVTIARSEAEIDAYYRAYRETVGRWERTPYMAYPLSFFRSLLRLANSGEPIRIWLSWRNQELLSGVVVLIQGHHAAYWHAASTDQGRAAHAGHLTVHTAILDAISCSARVFDFMPSADLEAVERFKSGFGAEPAEVGLHRFPGSRLYRGLMRLRTLTR